MRAIRAVVVACLCVTASLNVADAQSGVGTAQAGPFRCAFAEGDVAGGSAFLDVCVDYGPFAYAETGKPTRASAVYVHGVILVSTGKGVDVRQFGIDPLNPANPQPDVATSLFMDPAMSSGTLKLKVATMSIDISLTATQDLPLAWDGQYADQDLDQGSADGSPRLCLAALAGGGIEREAVVTGKIVSSTKGGGTLSGGDGAMRQGAGADGIVEGSAGTLKYCEFH